ncbi:MAG TPA: type VI secretion system accessory protein TagJ [Verrucomicrobiae bacterium]|jgi:type VI secretion system protein ImpE|nr:type VI secretion system accessory protein TagJ [Verrucomicrobiae bacterium]
MNAEELLQAGRVEESLASLQDAVRKNAADPRLRVFLFQTLSVLGQWKRALNQLDVLSNMGSDHMMMARIFQPVVQCEVLREQVFAGKHTPIVFGEPEPWMSWMVQANELVAQEKFGAASELREKAFEAAPASTGKLNDQPFEWIADADSRLGPMLEAIVEGRYYWIPFCRVKLIHLEKPADLRDLVWMPVQFVWTNGGEMSGHVPTRYPGTEKANDNKLRMARMTEWTECADGYSLGRGQRILGTDGGDYPLLECRKIEFTPAS